MTAAEYRARAEELLRQAARRGLPTHDRDRAERQAAVWASLAQSAAISEQTEAGEAEAVGGPQIH